MKYSLYDINKTQYFGNNIIQNISKTQLKIFRSTGTPNSTNLGRSLKNRMSIRLRIFINKTGVISLIKRNKEINWYL